MTNRFAFSILFNLHFVFVYTEYTNIKIVHFFVLKQHLSPIFFLTHDAIFLLLEHTAITLQTKCIFIDTYSTCNVKANSFQPVKTMNHTPPAPPHSLHSASAYIAPYALGRICAVVIFNVDYEHCINGVNNLRFRFEAFCMSLVVLNINSQQFAELLVVFGHFCLDSKAKLTNKTPTHYFQTHFRVTHLPQSCNFQHSVKEILCCVCVHVVPANNGKVL